MEVIWVPGDVTWFCFCRSQIATWPRTPRSAREITFGRRLQCQRARKLEETGCRRCRSFKICQKKRPMSIPTRTHKQIESNRDMQTYAVQSEVWYGMGNDGNDFPNNLVVLHIVKRWWNHWQKVDECSQSTVKLTRDLSHGLPGESWWLLMLMTSYRWALRLPPFFSSLKCKRLARPSNFPETSSILESDPWASLMIFMQTSEISEEKCMLPMLRSLQWWPCSLASKQLLQLGAVETS